MFRTHFCQINVKPQFSRSAPNPNIYRKIGRFVREFTTISEDYPIRKYYFRSSKAYQDEKIRHTQGKHWLSIHPFSNFEYFRHHYMCLVYVAAIIWDQMDVAYLSKHREYITVYGHMMLIINLIAFFDSLFNFFTGYVSKTERVNMNLATGYYKTAETATVLDIRSISINYLKTFFFADIFSFTNLLHLVFSPFYSSGLSTAFYVYAICRNIRIIRLLTVAKSFRICLTRLQVYQEIVTFLRFTFWFSFLSVFFGTVLISIPEMFSFFMKEDRNTFTAQLRKAHYHGGLELTEHDILIHSTYEAFRLLVIFQSSDMDKTVEMYLIVTTCMIIGNFLKIALTLHLYMIFNRRYQAGLKFKTFMTETKYFINNMNVNKQLTLDILNYFEVKLKKAYFNESDIFKTLQRHMQYEIFAQSSMGLIRNCHLFRNLPNYFVIQLSLRLKCETYIPGVKVISVGEIATCMYFIATGSVAVYSPEGKELCHLSDGEYVGEIGIMQSTVRVADIVTIEHCELYRLDIRDFQEVIKPNSKFYKRIYKIAMKRKHANKKNEEKKTPKGSKKSQK